MVTRRKFIYHTLISGMAISTSSMIGCQFYDAKKKTPVRKYHISLQAEAWEKNPELIGLMKAAGITDVWMGSYLQGKWYKSPIELREKADFLISNGLQPHVLTVPLGHPGNAIDPSDPTWSEKKQNWKNACDYDGSLYSGTSIHDQIIKDNLIAHKSLAKEGFDKLFLDDDFRLAKYPGKIGGCFCEDCKNEFLENYNYNLKDWETLIESVKNRNPTKILKSWIDFICNKEYQMFAALQKATPQMEIGIMVMYLGSEKAGIDLKKYQDVPFRVGELMFDDKGFDRIKGKTDELFSALFHRRFIKPELAYSETTAYPQDALSAKNMAAKLSISLLSDVRNTMFMSGLKTFPIAHWKTLAPAMKKSAELHQEIAGLKPKGPFKHYWGWGSRLVGEDKPFSLFLASGIPFEIIEEPTEDGWLFLSNEDANYFAKGSEKPKNNNLIVRKESEVTGDAFIEMNETLDDIFAFKKQIIPSLVNIPYVSGNAPVVFSWYPSVNKAILWNVNKEHRTFQIEINEKVIKKISLNGLDVVLIPNLI